jgi:hypothetical protein
MNNGVYTYEVFITDYTDDGWGRKTETTQSLGFTTAPSAAKAKQNMMYRNRWTKASLICEYTYGGFRRSTLSAKRVK